jgi:hypothetical protein
MDGGTGFVTMARSPSGDWRLGRRHLGRVPKWTKGADCKSAGVRLQRFESSHAHFPRRNFSVVPIGLCFLRSAEMFWSGSEVFIRQAVCGVTVSWS